MIFGLHSARVVISGISGCLPAVVLAASTTASVTVEVTVNSGLPCVINDNNAISVNFGVVIADLVDGKNYTTELPYTLSCTGQTKNSMRLRFTSSSPGSGFPSTGNVVTTGIDNLGVALTINGISYPLDVWVPFTYPTLPRLMATPVKRSGTTLVGGATGGFYASAALEVDYM